MASQPMANKEETHRQPVQCPVPVSFPQLGPRDRFGKKKNVNPCFFIRFSGEKYNQVFAVAAVSIGLNLVTGGTSQHERIPPKELQR